MKKLATWALAAALLAGCGGGDGESPTGLWAGTTGSNRTMTAVVLADGSYYLVYSTPANPAAVGGLVQGSGSFDGHNFVSADARDYNLEGAGVQPSAVAATIATRQAFTGTVTTGAAAAVTFTTAYQPEFEQPASLATLAGTYAGQVAFSLGARSATVLVTPAGAFSTSINGCPITGSVVPRTDGNVFNLSLTFGGAPCVFPNETFTGIARLDASSRLYALARNAGRTQGVVFTGLKQ